ncbi:hypothetical protein ACA910_008357 [Epithemia clementina (nom. ined.)]
MCSPALGIQSPDNILWRGLLVFGFAQDVQQRMSRSMKEGLFRTHYGSSEDVIAEIWYDLTVTEIPESQVAADENTEAGIKKFFISLHFLRVYPSSSRIASTHFKQCERLCHGANVWKWVEKIQGLKAEVIVWTDDLDDPNGQIMVVSVDGVDMKTLEQKHPTLPVDKKNYSQKYNHGAVKYEIAINVWTGKIVWIHGSYRGGAQ